MNIRRALTDGAGTYVIEGLPTGDYAVEFFDCSDRAEPLAQEFFDDEPGYFTATPVHVDVGGSAVIVDANLELEGIIAGRIVDPAGEPAAFTCVEVLTPTGWSVGYEQAGSDGRFSVGFLHEGDYHVFFDADPNSGCGSREDLASEWYDDAPDQAAAALVHVESGQTTMIEGELAVGGAITGTVTDADTGEPVEACAIAYHLSDGTAARGAGTLEDGSYRIEGLAPSDYHVRFIRAVDGDCFESPVEEWWNDRPDQASADVVTVVAEQDTSSIDAALAALPG